MQENVTLLFERYSEETASNGERCHLIHGTDSVFQYGQGGSSMKVGFIGAGKAGCSLGKYFSTSHIQQDAQTEALEVTGYYSFIKEDAGWAAQFTGSHLFESADEVIAASDAIIISTPDGAVKDVWNALDKEKINGRIICHLSGSLSSDVFSGIGEYGAYPVSIHPMFAFSDKDSVYRQLHQASFTLEGHETAVRAWQRVLKALGNAALPIDKSVKPKYHAAASILSNHVIAVLETGYELLGECGFSQEEAREFSRILVRDNVWHVIEKGSAEALTGPVERADTETIKAHLSVMSEEQRKLYCVCGKKLVQIAEEKNPERDYDGVRELLG